MKFRFYITTLFDGAIKGTDSEESALSFSKSEDFFVVDTKTGEWMVQGGRLPVEEI